MKTLVRQTSTIAYRDTGSGRPLVWLHGWGVNGAFFQPQFDALGDRFRLIAPDLRGHGQSSAFDANSTFPDLADDVRAIIDHEHLDAPIIIGWSLGAMVAWDLLSRHTDLEAAGLVTIDMVPRMLNTPQWSHGLRYGSDYRVFERSLSAMRADWDAFTAVFLPRVFARGSEAAFGELKAELRDEARRNDSESMARLWVQLVELDYRDRLAAIQVPTLVVHGEKSQLYRPAASQWVAGQIDRAQIRGFPQSGHAPHLEEPDEFNRMLARFSEAQGWHDTQTTDSIP